MKIQMAVASCALWLFAACGGSSVYHAKCELACRPPSSSACTSQDPSQCTSDCDTVTTGLSSACAQCVIDHTGWNVESSNGSTSGSDGGTGGTCGGYSVGKPTSNPCAPYCLAGDGGA